MKRFSMFATLAATSGGSAPSRWMASPRTSQIYVSLLDEGTDVWRLAAAEHIRDDIYRIVGEIPADERWQFVPGQVVRVRQQTLSGSACLTAYEAAAV